MPQPTTIDGSPDVLPLKGYTRKELANYIRRNLGGGVFKVELTETQIYDAIQDALGLYSQYKPLPKYGAIQLVSGVHSYLEGEDLGYGVSQVDFVDPVPGPTEIFYGNLISPAPLFRTGLDEYDTFTRWRKTWQRVTSVRPDWMYDEGAQVLRIYNPIERYHAGVVCLMPHEKTESLPLVAASWVKEYSLEKARYTYGEVLAKFSGAVPGPLKDLQLDTVKRDKAEERLQKLQEKLVGMGDYSAIQID